MTVVVLDSTAQNALTVPNKGLCSFAVAQAADILDGTAQLTVCSDVIVPLDTLAFELQGLYRYTPEDLLKLAPDAFGILLKQYGGKLYTTSFLFGMVETKVDAGESVAGYYTAEQITLTDAQDRPFYTYQRFTACAADAVSDGETVYYRYAVRKGYESFNFYGSYTNTAVPRDAVFTFAYGETAVDSKTSGALMQTILVKDYQHAGVTAAGSEMLPYLIATNGGAEGYLLTEVARQGYTTAHTLGEAVARQGLSSTAAGSDDYYKLTYVDAQGNTVSEESFAIGNCFGFYIVLDDTAEAWSVTTAEGTVSYAAGDRVLITGETTVRPVA